MTESGTVEGAGTAHPPAAAARADHASSLSLLAVAASTLILIRGASRFTFFDDEAFSLRRYILPMGEMVAALFRGVEPDPPLYYIIENAWIGLVGVSSPLLMRIPSIVFFVAGLIVLRRGAAAWFGEPTGRIAQVMAALHPAHLLFGMAARWYSLMFLVVAMLLWMTAPATRPGCGRFWRLIGWSIAAATVVYTNYFGVAVVGLAWLAGIWTSIRGGLKRDASDVGVDQSRHVLTPVICAHAPDGERTLARDRAGDSPALIGVRRARGPNAVWRGWVFAGLAVVAAYSPWLPAFYRQLLIFPQSGGGIDAPVRAAVRTTLALTSGNLALPTAWWVHGPMAVFTIIICVGAVRSIRRSWPMVLMVAGCFVAGVVSKTMLDKYVLSFSGLACVLGAAVLVGGRNAGVSRFDQRMMRLASICLLIGWISCGVHLVTGRYWSSLRWLDPFDDAATAAIGSTMGGGGLIVTSHPAAAYYLARSLADIAQPDGGRPRSPVGSKRVYMDVFSRRLTPTDRPPEEAERLPAVLSPAGALAALQLGSRAPVRMVVVEAAEFQGDSTWAAVRERLADRYSLSAKQSLLPDPDAELKDRLDPRFKHPRFRIEVLTWDLK